MQYSIVFAIPTCSFDQSIENSAHRAFPMNQYSLIWCTGNGYSTTVKTQL